MKFEVESGWLKKLLDSLWHFKKIPKEYIHIIKGEWYGEIRRSFVLVLKTPPTTEKLIELFERWEQKVKEFRKYKRGCELCGKDFARLISCSECSKKVCLLCISGRIRKVLDKNGKPEVKIKCWKCEWEAKPRIKTDNLTIKKKIPLFDKGRKEIQWAFLVSGKMQCTKNGNIWGLCKGCESGKIIYALIYESLDSLSISTSPVDYILLCKKSGGILYTVKGEVERKNRKYNVNLYFGFFNNEGTFEFYLSFPKLVNKVFFRKEKRKVNPNTPISFYIFRSIDDYYLENNLRIHKAISF